MGTDSEKLKDGEVLPGIQSTSQIQYCMTESGNLTDDVWDSTVSPFIIDKMCKYRREKDGCDDHILYVYIYFEVRMYWIEEA